MLGAVDQLWTYLYGCTVAEDIIWPRVRPHPHTRRNRIRTRAPPPRPAVPSTLRDCRPAVSQRPARTDARRSQPSRGTSPPPSSLSPWSSSSSTTSSRRDAVHEHALQRRAAERREDHARGPAVVVQCIGANRVLSTIKCTRTMAPTPPLSEHDAATGLPARSEDSSWASYGGRARWQALLLLSLGLSLLLGAAVFLAASLALRAQRCRGACAGGAPGLAPGAAAATLSALALLAMLVAFRVVAVDDSPRYA